MGDPTDVGHAVHVHFDQSVKQFGMLVDATAAAYFVKMTQGGRSITSRVAIVR